MVSGPELCRLINDFDAVSSKPQSATEERAHHEQTKSSDKTFLQNVKNLTDEITGLGNPFLEESNDLFALDSKRVSSNEAVHDLQTMDVKGEEQFQSFCKSIQSQDGSLFYSPLKKNKLNLFSTKDKTARKDPSDKLKGECTLFQKLFISCQTRQLDLDDLDEFFAHENQHAPPSLSDDTHIYTGSKSQLLDSIESFSNEETEVANADACIIDGAAWIHSAPPGGSKTFQDYCVDVLKPKLLQYAHKHKRVDIVFDIYKDTRLKAHTREIRGKGIRRTVTAKGRMPDSWESFLRVNENKTELFAFVAEQLVAGIETKSTIIITKGDSLISNMDVTNKECISPCNHEVADTRVLLHAKHVVLAVSKFNAIGAEKLSLAFGNGKSFRHIYIGSIVVGLGPKAAGLAFFHAFTGCDSVSAFMYKGKQSAWKTWSVYEDVTEIFHKLGHQRSAVTADDMAQLEQFVIYMYDKGSGAKDVNQARLELFTKKQRAYDSIPPSRAALKEHAKRAAYQSGYIWDQSLVSQQTPPSPADWGWQKCGCKKRSCNPKTCKCRKSYLQCTALCSCKCVYV